MVQFKRTSEFIECLDDEGELVAFIRKTDSVWQVRFYYFTSYFDSLKEAKQHVIDAMAHRKAIADADGRW